MGLGSASGPDLARTEYRCTGHLGPRLHRTGTGIHTLRVRILRGWDTLVAPGASLACICPPAALARVFCQSLLCDRQSHSAGHDTGSSRAFLWPAVRLAYRLRSHASLDRRIGRPDMADLADPSSSPYGDLRSNPRL